MHLSPDDPRRNQIRFHTVDEVMTFGIGDEFTEIAFKIDLSSVGPEVESAELIDDAASVCYHTPVERVRKRRCWIGPGPNDYDEVDETVMVRHEKITPEEFRERFATAIALFDEAYDEFWERTLTPENT